MQNQTDIEKTIRKDKLMNHLKYANYLKVWFSKCSVGLLGNDLTLSVFYFIHISCFQLYIIKLIIKS